MERAIALGLSLVLVSAFGPATEAGAREHETGTREGTVTVAAAGDIACRAGSEPSEDECQHKATSDLVRDMNPDAALVLGDNVPDGELRDYRGSYDPTWGRFLDETHPVAGNHEYEVPDAEGYFDYFGRRAGDRDKGYYSFDLGSWHLIALNSECDEVGGCERGSRQERWLRADLAANSKPCTLAFWHAPRYSSGKFRGSSSKYTDFWKALYDARADLVLSGHGHHYERFAPQDARGNEDGNGVRQFVVGTGGQKLHPLDDPEPASEARSNESFGVLKLTLSPDRYAWEFAPVDRGGFTETGSASCHSTDTDGSSAATVDDPPGGTARFESNGEHLILCDRKPDGRRVITHAQPSNGEAREYHNTRGNGTCRDVNFAIPESGSIRFNVCLQDGPRAPEEHCGDYVRASAAG